MWVVTVYAIDAMTEEFVFRMEKERGAWHVCESSDVSRYGGGNTMVLSQGPAVEPPKV